MVLERALAICCDHWFRFCKVQQLQAFGTGRNDERIKLAGPGKLCESGLTRMPDCKKGVKYQRKHVSKSSCCFAVSSRSSAWKSVYSLVHHRAETISSSRIHLDMLFF